MAVTLQTEQAVESGKDPVQVLSAILRDKELDDENKAALIKFSRERFRYRRSMATVALWAIVLQLPVLYLSGFTSVSFSLSSEVSTLVTWIDGFLVGIVGAYYGTTAWRPAS